MTAAQRAYLMSRPQDSDKKTASAQSLKPVKRLSMKEMQKMTQEAAKRRAGQKKGKVTETNGSEHS